MYDDHLNHYELNCEIILNQNLLETDGDAWKLFATIIYQRYDIKTNTN